MICSTQLNKSQFQLGGVYPTFARDSNKLLRAIGVRGTRGGRTVNHASSFRLSATTVFRAWISGNFCTALLIAVISACFEMPFEPSQCSKREQIAGALIFAEAVMVPHPFAKRLSRRKTSAPLNTPKSGKVFRRVSVYAQTPD